jgi:hypothetical protein
MDSGSSDEHFSGGKEKEKKSVINTEVINFVEFATKYVLLRLDFFLQHFPAKFQS